MTLPQLLAPLMPQTPQEFDRIGALAGQGFYDAAWFRSADQARRVLEPWMPLWFVPLGTHSAGLPFGLDLSPERRGAARAHIVEVRDASTLIGVADGVVEYVQTRLVDLDCRHREDPSEREFRARLRDDLARAEALLGAGLYDPGAWPGEDWSSEIRWRLGHRAPDVTVDRASYGSNRERLATLMEGIVANPRCMYLRYDAVNRLFMEGDTEAAAAQAAELLRCPSWTRYIAVLDEALGLAELLRSLHPDRIDAVKRASEATAEQLRAEGDLEGAVAMMVDVGFDQGTTDALVDPWFRPLFEELGWSWALRLCDLRVS